MHPEVPCSSLASSFSRDSSIFSYTEFGVQSSYSFLTSGSNPVHYLRRLKTLIERDNHPKACAYNLAVAEFMSFGSMVRYDAALREVFGATFTTTSDALGGRYDDKLIPKVYFGIKVVVQVHGFYLLLQVYPHHKVAYQKLCREVSLAYRDHNTYEPLRLSALRDIEAEVLFNPLYVTEDEFTLLKYTGLGYALRDEDITNLAGALSSLNLTLLREHHYRSYSEDLSQVLDKFCSASTAPVIFHNDVVYAIKAHAHRREILKNVALPIPEENHERYLQSLESYRLLGLSDEELRVSGGITDRLKFSIQDLEYEYPDHRARLRTRVYERGRSIYGEIPAKVQGLLEEELALIEELKYERYFLTCAEIVDYAKSLGIRCQGRGAGANSAVCFCLGITAVDPMKIDLYFGRFISKERAEPPDIDIDFEHKRREEVFNFIYARFGREHSALISSITTFKLKSAVRVVAAYYGLKPSEVNYLAKNLNRFKRYALNDEVYERFSRELIEKILRDARELLGYPHHRATHVGGFVISKYPLNHLGLTIYGGRNCRTILEFDKYDVDDLNILKIDILALGMLSALSLGFREVAKLGGEVQLDYQDPEVFRRISDADTVGVFQIESRAQINMVSRLRPKSFYDLVIQVAIVRPGPIVGKMVHPYLRRREKKDKVVYKDSSLEHILAKTLGVVLFQEQMMRLAVYLADFTPGEADQLRRKISKFKINPHDEILKKLIERIETGAARRGYSSDERAALLEQVKSFAEYGFPESHAASFALLVYQSCWLKFKYPECFLSAMLCAQPLGFYTVNQLLEDSKKHVQALPIDINSSEYYTTVIGRGQIRLGFHLLKKLTLPFIDAVVRLRPFSSLEDAFSRLLTYFGQRSYEYVRTQLMILAAAAPFAGYNAQSATWRVAELKASQIGQPRRTLELDSIITKDPYTQSLLDLDTKRYTEVHPLIAARSKFQAKFPHVRLKRGDELSDNYPSHDSHSNLTGQTSVTVLGLLAFRQRPPTAKGFLFMTLEDETGMINIVVPPDLVGRYADVIQSERLFLVRGRVTGNRYIRAEEILAVRV